MPNNFFCWDIKSVACFPSQVSLIRLLPNKDIIECLIASILYKMSTTEIKAASQAMRFKWPWQTLMILSYNTIARYESFSVISELVPSHRCNWMISNKSYFTEPIRVVCHCEAIRIGWKNRVFTCITTMKLFNQVYVPVLFEAVVAIDLKLIVLAIVMTLDHMSCMVHIFGLFMPYIFNEYRRWGCMRFDLLNILL